MQIALTIGIFLLTLFFMLRPPRGMNEAWATVGGGLLMLLFGRVTLAQAVAITRQGADILAFLFTLMLLAALLDGSGFFEWAARRAARAASGSAVALYRNMFLLGALITILLSLDTTAVILTPIALAFVARLKLPPRPFLISCAFVANAGSLLLPVSNLTNLLFVRAFGWSFSSFALRMALPQGAALLVGYGAMRWLYRKELPLQFDAGELPEPKSALPDIFYFRGAVVVLIAVLVGYFSGRLLLRFAAANSALSSRALRLRGAVRVGSPAQATKTERIGAWNFVVAVSVCRWAVCCCSRRGKSGTGGSFSAGLAGGGNASAGANFGGGVQRGPRLQCGKQYPRRFAFHFRLANGPRRCAHAIWRPAWLQYRPESHGCRFACNDARFNDGAAQRNGHSRRRFSESGSCRHAAGAGCGGAGALAVLFIMALKFRL